MAIGIDELTHRYTPRGDISTVAAESQCDPLTELEQLDVEQLTAEKLVEAVVLWGYQAYGKDTFVKGQEEFQALTGKVFYDDWFYNGRISYFLDYFVLERSNTLEDTGAETTVYDAFAHWCFESGGERSEGLIDAFGRLRGYRHSVFSISRLNKSQMVVKDLLRGDNLTLSGECGSFAHGFKKGCIFQGFLFPEGSGYCLSQGLILHPTDASSVIRKQVAKLLKLDYSEFQILTRLAKQNIHCMRHRNLRVQDAYSRQP